MTSVYTEEGVLIPAEVNMKVRIPVLQGFKDIERRYITDKFKIHEVLNDGIVSVVHLDSINDSYQPGIMVLGLHCIYTHPQQAQAVNQ